MYAADSLQKRTPVPVPRETAIGSLLNYAAHCETDRYQPVNITFALLPPLAEDERKRLRRKADRKARQIEIALRAFDEWLFHMQARISIGDVERDSANA
jgi:methylenetetrahydrofolate--tRNA-(uracil-5-)-methyltransferase